MLSLMMNISNFYRFNVKEMEIYQMEIHGYVVVKLFNTWSFKDLS